RYRRVYRYSDANGWFGWAFIQPSVLLGQAKKRMGMLIESIIEEKRKNNSGCAPRDVVDVLINDASDQLTDDLISDNMIDLMIPAEDSVPVLVTLAVKFLSECPLALQHLQVPNKSFWFELLTTGRYSTCSCMLR
ncbi:hypothetical protein BHE74_00021837, partial [Ensete ventricosum]